MAIRIRQLVIGIATAVTMAVVGVSLIGAAVALAPATERARASLADSRRPDAPFPGRLSEHQQLRRIFIDEGRERLR